MVTSHGEDSNQPYEVEFINGCIIIHNCGTSFRCLELLILCVIQAHHSYWHLFIMEGIQLAMAMRPRFSWSAIWVESRKLHRAHIGNLQAHNPYCQMIKHKEKPNLTSCPIRKPAPSLTVLSTIIKQNEF